MRKRLMQKENFNNLYKKIVYLLNLPKENKKWPYHIRSIFQNLYKFYFLTKGFPLDSAVSLFSFLEVDIAK